jgi:hypothetical protein
MNQLQLLQLLVQPQQLLLNLLLRQLPSAVPLLLQRQWCHQLLLMRLLLLPQVQLC